MIPLRDLFKIASLTAILSIVPSLLLQAKEKLNVVYIMADELGYFETSYMGSKTITTPRIDDLAKRGVWFTQGLAGSAVCAPTRCCFLTGKHSGHTSVRVNGGGTPLRSDEETIGSMLKRRGYATGGFGKWGCGGRGSTGVPEDHGFDRKSCRLHARCTGETVDIPVHADGHHRSVIVIRRHCLSH